MCESAQIKIDTNNVRETMGSIDYTSQLNLATLAKPESL